MLKTIEFINEHKENWKELLSQPPYSIIIKEDDYYYLLKYNQIESDFNEPICRECRGLIIDRQTLEPVALSFKKFFNIQEQYASYIDWNTAKVQEKVDGSKILMFWNKYKEKWQICTSGNLNAYQCPVGGFEFTFGDLFDRALYNNNLSKEYMFEIADKKFCYTFELVSPESKIVVPYPKADIYLIGVRNLETWREIFPNYSSLYKILHIKRPKAYSLHSAVDCLKAAEAMGYDEEGFVVVDKQFNRVKIKSPSYLAASYLGNNGVHSNHQILDIILKNEQSEFLSYFPEWKDKFEVVENNLINFKNYSLMVVNQVLVSHKEPGKELADYIMKNFSTVSDLCFKAAKKFSTKADIDDEKIKEIHSFVDEWFKSNPKNKKLELLGL